MNTIAPSSAQTSIFEITADDIPAGNMIEVDCPAPAKVRLIFSGNVANLNTEVETVAEIIERVHANASDEWRTKATEILRTLCQNRLQWDLDDLAEVLKPIEHLSHKPRATGQLVVKAKADGWCVFLKHEKSTRKSRHYGIISVYESLLF